MIGSSKNYLYLTLQIVSKSYPGARAGIRTRVSGMKTRDDGPGYTTRANDLPCHLLFIIVGHPTISKWRQRLFQNTLNKIVHRLLRERFRFVERHGAANDVAAQKGELVAHSHETMRPATAAVCRKQDLPIVEQLTEIIRFHG